MSQLLWLSPNSEQIDSWPPTDHFKLLRAKSLKAFEMTIFLRLRLSLGEEKSNKFCGWSGYRELPTGPTADQGEKVNVKR